MAKNKIINVKGTEITVIQKGQDDFISLTDMVKGFEEGLVLIEKWLRNKNTIEFIGIWEEMNNPVFNSPEFGGIKNDAGLNRFTLSVKKWIEKTNAIGIIAKTGRYNSGTFAHRDIAFEFGSWLSPELNEADLLNVALFGKTAKQWREENPNAKGNVRDEASIMQLVVLSNLESTNAVLIHQGLSQPERLIQLNKIAITQMKSLVNSKQIKELK